jgi:hypothetical protein
LQKEIEAMKEDIPLELTLQMGRPVAQGAGEVKGLLERSKYMLDDIAASASLSQTPTSEASSDTSSVFPSASSSSSHPGSTPYLQLYFHHYPFKLSLSLNHTRVSLVVRGP